MFSKLFCALVLFTSSIQATVTLAHIDIAKIDGENIVSGPHYPFLPMRFIQVVDSSTEYTCGLNSKNAWQIIPRMDISSSSVEILQSVAILMSGKATIFLSQHSRTKMSILDN